MSISEARRQIELAQEIAIGSLEWHTDKVIAHVGLALVEALAESKPYDGELNSIRIPVQTLRQLTVELVQAGQDDIGLESLIVSLRSRIKGSDLDK